MTTSSNQDHDDAHRSSPSSSSSPNSTSKSGRSSGSSEENNNQTRRLGGGRFMVVLPFRGGGNRATTTLAHDPHPPRSGQDRGQGRQAAGRRRTRPRLLTEETWWVVHNPVPPTTLDDPPRTDGNNDGINSSNYATHLQGTAAPHQPSFTGAGLLGRMRIRSVDRGTLGAAKHPDFPLEYSSEDDDDDKVDDNNPNGEKGVRGATSTDNGAEDQDSIASSKLSTLSNVSERRIMWNPPSAQPAEPSQVPVEGRETQHRHPHEDNIVEGLGRFPFSSVPLEIFVPIASCDAASSNVPEWLRITTSLAQDRSTGDDSDGDHGAAFHPAEAVDAATPPPPPPHSPLSFSSTPPPRHLLMPRLAPLVTTEPSPSIPRPTLGKHSQSAPVADLYSYQRRQIPPTAMIPSPTNHLPRPQSLHQISTPTRRRPQSVSTGLTRDGHRSGGTRISLSSYRSAHGSASMMSTGGATGVSQLSDADKKLLGSRERYQNTSDAKRRFPSSSSCSVRTLSVGSLVGQSSWVTAPGLTVATSSGSFEPNSSRGSPRSRRSVRSVPENDRVAGEPMTDGIENEFMDRGPASNRSRRSLLHVVGRGDAMMSRWMDRGVAWMTAARHLRPQTTATTGTPVVRIVPKGSDTAAPASRPDLQRSSGCLT